MSGWALAWRANSGSGGYLRTSSNMVSIAGRVSASADMVHPRLHVNDRSLGWANLFVHLRTATWGRSQRLVGALRARPRMVAAAGTAALSRLCGTREIEG